ncbi:NAD-dependent epimerase/dehydratase family protein [Nocardioides insulae]|uniref:NAD-dependent epimerase/dehydratase family protein n=1 Tax=Nocardioides insulae TaxID=394734 RepID=UPI00055BE296|nr:NAD-dependent epimerase/dehydratase family protein [Nocardioides insulae]
MKRILILGGTSWLGGVLAEQALRLGHQVTSLARGESGTAPVGARWVRADRLDPAAYDGVRGQEWDDVIELTWQPGFARGAVHALADRAAHWTFVSTCSVYADDSTPHADETAGLRHRSTRDRATREEYGEAKVACEEACAEALGDRLLIARAGLIGGPGDRSDRYGYWVGRFALAQRGPVLVPDAPAQSSQVIDVRDAADWLLGAGGGLTGTFHLVGEQLPLREVLGLARAIAGHSGDVVPAPESWLNEREVAPWMGPRSLPLWLPGPELAGHAARSDTRALSAGLVRRSASATLQDTLADELARGLERPRAAGLTRTEELDLIRELRPTPAPGRPT